MCVSQYITKTPTQHKINHFILLPPSLPSTTQAMTIAHYITLNITHNITHNMTLNITHNIANNISHNITTINNTHTQVSWVELRNVTRMSTLDGPASTYIWFGEKQFLYTDAETLNNFRYQIYLIEFKT